MQCGCVCDFFAASCTAMEQFLDGPHSATPAKNNGATARSEQYDTRCTQRAVIDSAQQQAHTQRGLWRDQATALTHTAERLDGRTSLVLCDVKMCLTRPIAAITMVSPYAHTAPYARM